MRRARAILAAVAALLFALQVLGPAASARPSVPAVLETSAVVPAVLAAWERAARADVRAHKDGDAGPDALLPRPAATAGAPGARAAGVLPGAAPPTDRPRAAQARGPPGPIA